MDKEQTTLEVQAGEEQQSDNNGPRFPELQELQEEVQRRIKNNQKFLRSFMEEDFDDEDDEQESGEREGQDPLDFEEL